MEIKVKETFKPKVKKDVYELEDADYLLIKAIRDLATAIRGMK